MRVVQAKFPLFGIDCDTVLGPGRAKDLKAAGIGFAIRYLGSLTNAEAGTILDAGLQLSVVTFSRAPGWRPTPGMGTQDGNADLLHLKGVGVPVGATVWIDLEGCAGSEPETARWVEERSKVLVDADYQVGLYVGFDQPMTGDQLYNLPNVTRYWKSFSNVPTPTCGWSLLQLYKTVTIAGTQVDVDAVQFDYLNRLPMLIAP